MARAHLQPLTLDELNWTANKAAESLHELISRVRARAQEAIDWYINAKDAKKWGATITRSGTILATTMTVYFTAGLQMSSIVPFGDPGLLAASAAAIAAVLQGFDRFFGFSKAWMRYISTELKIRTALSAFNMSWPSRTSKWAGGVPSDDQVQDAITACVAFITEVDAAVRQETDQWIADFQASLKDLEDATKAAAAATRSASDAEAERARQQEADKKAKEDAVRAGSLNITVTNGTDFPSGWKILIPDRAPQTGSGMTAAVTDIGPGNVPIVVEGDANGMKKRAEQAVQIPAGTIAKCSVTLE